MIYRFSTLGSTNDEAQSEKYINGDVIVAEHQCSGRGQRGNKWLSGEGLNLTLSAIFLPQRLESRRQFLVSQATALALCDLLHTYSLAPKIKWTNDIYIGDRKIAGILIENKLSGNYLARSIVGIGLNVNEQDFDPSLPNPTSIRVESGSQVDREELLLQLEGSLHRRLEQVTSHAEQIASDYQALIYRRGELHNFALPTIGERRGAIESVGSTGELSIVWESGERGSYLFGQIEFVIETRKR